LVPAQKIAVTADGQFIGRIADMQQQGARSAHQRAIATATMTWFST